MRIIHQEIISAESDAQLPNEGLILRTTEDLQNFWIKSGRPDIASGCKLEAGTIGVAAAMEDPGMTGCGIGFLAMDRGNVLDIGWVAKGPQGGVGLEAFGGGNPTAVAIYADPGKEIKVQRLQPGDQVMKFLGKTPSKPSPGF